MRKTGISAASLGQRGIPFDLNEDIFKTCKENDLTAMEISLDFRGPFFELDYKKLDEYSKKYGVEIWSYHMPFGDEYDPSTLNPEMRQNMFDSYEKLMDMLTVTDVKKIVVHPSAEPIETDKETRALRMQAAREALSRLSEYAETKGMKIAVECLPRTCLGNDTAEMLELVSANPKLEVCFDVNHIAHGTHKEFVEALGDRITTLHISDYVIEDNHLLPFNGEIDWKELIDLLNGINYSGPFLYECTRFQKVKTYEPSIYRELHEKIENL